jgi:hypothetical protein
MIDVEVRALDELISSGTVEAPDLIKMDIEGAEVGALKGALTMLSAQRPSLLIEIHGTGAELEPLLEAHGYESQVIDSELRLSEAPWGMYVVATPR